MNWITIILLTFFSTPLLATSDIIELETPFIGSSLFTLANSKGKLPAVIIFHGSEGGLNGRMRNQARVIARKGYLAMAYCYFDCQRSAGENVGELHNVNLDKSYQAFKWLKNNSSGKVGIYGVSRGAEKALLLSSIMAIDHLELPNAVVVHAPSDTVVVGFNPNWNHQNKWMCWKKDNELWDNSCGTPPPPLIELNSFPAWSYRGKSLELNHGTRIPIEKYRGPIFITHGEEDDIWEVERTQKIIYSITKARENFGGVSPKVHYFPAQGHRLDSENESKRWNMMFDFLEQHLK